MAESQVPAASGGLDDLSLKLAIASSFLPSEAYQNQHQQHPPTVSSLSSDSNALRWKRKVSVLASPSFFFIFIHYLRGLIEDQWKF